VLIRFNMHLIVFIFGWGEIILIEIFELIPERLWDIITEIVASRIVSHLFFINFNKELIKYDLIVIIITITGMGL